jgi:hypothetical protein
VATKVLSKKNEWNFKIVDNPRNNLDVNYDITPGKTGDLKAVIDAFYPSPSSESDAAIAALYAHIAKISLATGTLIIIDDLDTEGYSKYFSLKKKVEESYVFNSYRYTQLVIQNPSLSAASVSAAVMTF